MRTHATVAVALALGMAPLVGAEADVREHRINDNLRIIEVDDEAWQPEGFVPARVVSAAFAEQRPTIDGVADEPAWAASAAVTVPLTHGRVQEATLRAVYTTDEVFLLVSWPDPTADVQHHPWVWSVEDGRWVEGTQVEDSLLVSIEGGCDWSPSLLAGYVYDFDAWHWLAARSNPVGQAVDADGSTQNHFVPDLGFVRYDSRNRQPFWNVKFTDRRPDILTTPWNELSRLYKYAPIVEQVYVRYQPDGSPPPDMVQRLEPPPAMVQAVADTGGSECTTGPEDEGGVPATLAPQYRPLRLHGDAGEVAAKGAWADGRWTVEFGRRRVTPAATSTDSLIERVTQFSIHVFDQTERVDESSESGRLWLQFEPAPQAVTP